MQNHELTTILSFDNFKTHYEASVTWVPLAAEGVDEPADANDCTPMIWDDEENPPVHFRCNRRFRTVELVEDMVCMKGTCQWVFEPFRVKGDDPLEPGEYRVDWLEVDGERVDPDLWISSAE